MRAVLVALATSMVALLRSRASLHLEILAQAPEKGEKGTDRKSEKAAPEEADR